MIDIDKIKEAAARQGTPLEEETDRALLLAAVPDLIAEIERLAENVAALRDGADAYQRAAENSVAEIARLQTLAQEGWTEARSIWEGNDTTIDGRLDAALAEIGEAPAHVKTVDLRIDPEVQDTIRKATAEIERLARLAHVGWERARSEAEEAGNEEGETFAAETLDQLEAVYGTEIAEPKS